MPLYPLLPMETTEVFLTAAQIRYLMDMMMGCSLGISKHHAYLNGVDDNALYNHLENCLPDPPDPTECW